MKTSIFLMCLIALVVLFSGCTQPELEPTVCTKESKVCPDGSTVSRNSTNNCKFDPCPEINNMDSTQIEIQLKDVYKRFEKVDCTFTVNFKGDVIEGRVNEEFFKGNDKVWSWSTYYKREQSNPKPVMPLSNEIAFPFSIEFPDNSGSTSECSAEETEVVLKMDFYNCEDIKGIVDKSCSRISVEEFENAGIEPTAHAEKTVKIEGGSTMEELLETCNGDVDCLKCKLYNDGCYPSESACK